MRPPGLFIRALGPLRASHGQRDIALPKAQVRTALALMLTRVGQVVSSDVIADVIWDGHPPRSGHHGLHVIMSGLRTSLESIPDDRHTHLASRPPGYMLDLSEDEFDIVFITGLVNDARACIGEGGLEEAEALLIAAEALWHGPPYAEFTYAEFAQHEIRRLTELRLQMIEDRAGVQLSLGRHRDLIAELDGLVAEHPTRERLLRSLMAALQQADRPIEALQRFDNARTRMRAEFGSDPSGATVQLAESIRRPVPSR